MMISSTWMKGSQGTLWRGSSCKSCVSCGNANSNRVARWNSCEGATNSIRVRGGWMRSQMGMVQGREVDSVVCSSTDMQGEIESNLNGSNSDAILRAGDARSEDARSEDAHGVGEVGGRENGGMIMGVKSVISSKKKLAKNLNSRENMRMRNSLVLLKGALHSSPYDGEIFALALPALMTTLMDPLMGMVDTAIVGRLGTAQLASVGLVTAVFNFSNFMFNFLLYTTTPRIAAAVSSDDSQDSSSKIASQGLWLALTIGCTMMAFLFSSCHAIFLSMGASPDVMHHAVPYLRIRCLASPCIMMLYVLAGTCRGHKDTSSPLKAGIWSNIVHLVLDVVCVFWLNLGAVGAAVATTLSLWLNFALLFGSMMRQGYIQASDMTSIPSYSDVAPMMKNGFLLSTRSILGMTILVTSTKLITGLGAVSLGSHEILRQIWVISNQFFTSLDIATQSLIAFYLGRSDRDSAASVFVRTLGLTTLAGAIVMSILWTGRSTISTIFTTDANVMATVAYVMPLIALFMPFDGMASVMDGVLLGSQQAAWMSKTMVATAMCCGLGLLYCSSLGPGCTILSVWSVIKMLTAGRFIGNAWRIWSNDSPLGPSWWANAITRYSSSAGTAMHSTSMARSSAPAAA